MPAFSQMISWLIVTVVLSVGSLAFGQPARVQIDDAGKPIARDMFGYNINIISAAGDSRLAGAPWDDPDVRQAIASLHAGHIRFPGGTIAQMYHWDTDTLANPWPGKGPDAHLPAFDRMVNRNIRGNADAFLKMTAELDITPIWVFNLVQDNRPDPWAFVEQLARKHGGRLPITSFELGNESPHWEALEAFETYHERAGELGRKLQREFPNVATGANAWEPIHLWQPTVGQAERPHGRQWNDALAEHDDFYSAVIMHVYLNTWFHFRNRPVFSLPDEAARVRYLFAMGDYLPQAVVDYHKGHFGDRPLWLTEYGILGRGAPLHQWGYLLAETNYALQLLTHSDTIRYMSKHYLIQPGPTQIAAVEMKVVGGGETAGQLVGAERMWPVGAVYALIGEAVREAQSTHRLDIGPTGSFDGYLALKDRSFPMVNGAAVRGEQTTYVFLVNRSDQPQQVTLPDGAWTMVQVHAGMERSHREAQPTQGRVGDGEAVTLPPLSFTRLHNPPGDPGDWDRHAPPPAPEVKPFTEIPGTPVDQAPATGQNLLRNGGFEEDYAAGGGTQPAGWSEGMADDIDAGDSMAVRLFRAASRAHEGTRYAAFGGPPDQLLGGVLYQDVQTTPGADYLLSFHVEAQGNPAFDQVLRVELIDPATDRPIMAERVTKQATPARSLSSQSYMTVHRRFTATGTTTRLRFTNTSTTTAGADLLLDTVSIAQITP